MTNSMSLVARSQGSEVSNQFFDSTEQSVRPIDSLPLIFATVNTGEPKKCEFAAKKIKEKPEGDVTFIIQGKYIQGNKAKFADVPFFKNIFQGLRNSQRMLGPISLGCDESTPETFLALREFLYYKEFPEGFLDDMAKVIELHQFAAYFGFEDLCSALRKQIGDRISRENWIDVAVFNSRRSDPGLTRVCSKFLKSSPSETDLENLATQHPVNLLMLLDVAEEGCNKKLQDVCEDELLKTLSLNDCFVELCNAVFRKRDPALRMSLLHIISKSSIFSDLIGGKEGKYKNHWRAYKKVLNLRSTF